MADELYCLMFNTRFPSVFPVPLEGLKSQGAFEQMRQLYIRELTKAIHVKEKSLVASSQRFYHLTKLMDAMHEVGGPLPSGKRETNDAPVGSS